MQLNKTQKATVLKWIAALLSGKYRQAKQSLRTSEGYCCLGVLCDVAPEGGEWIPVGKDIERDRTLFDFRIGNRSVYDIPPTEVLQAVGLVDDNASEDHPQRQFVSRLAMLNDRHGKSFKQIAAEIALHHGLVEEYEQMAERQPEVAAR